MAIAEELNSFVKQGLERGLPRVEMERALLAAGWPAEQVRAAMAGFVDSGFPIPVPRPRPYLTAREAFLYLVLFSSLYASAFSLGSLLFQLVNHALPDPAASPQSAQYLRDAIRMSISSLVVAMPVFLFVARLTSRETARDPAKRASKVRRWLTYLTLFIAAAVLTGDVTSLVYNMLGGELTLRFVLKALIIGAIAGTIFVHYLRDLRREEGEGEGPRGGPGTPAERGA